MEDNYKLLPCLIGNALILYEGRSYKDI